MKLIIVALVIGLCLCQSEQSWEQQYLGIPSASAAYEHLAYYTSLPHLAGTPGDYETALYTAAKFQEYGLEASIEEEIALLTYPVSRLVQVTYPDGSTYTCTLQEDYEPVDPTSGDPRVVPTFNGYSPSGDVTAQAVYVNYGRKEDFETLVSMNVSLQGNIAIARYGSIFRGTKAMIAQEYGMVGLIIYSDPADDGYAKGPVYPEGPWRSNSSVQRGSVLFLSVCPGNPTRDVCVTEPNRADYSYTQVIPSIPVQPISYADALPILSSLEGPEAPADFVGALPITYYLGPGPGTVRLNLEIEFVNTTIWNVVGKIAPDPSSPVKSEQVLIGNHRDAWVFGAVDPSSGSAMLLEVARGYGELLKQGWKPQREVLFLSWDAEEYGLVGSTAYAERHADSLSANAVVYINVDSAVSGGSFSVEATPSLNDLIRNVSTSVPYPGTSGTLRDNWSGAIGVLGSGSDYTAFIDHFGIPCLSMAMNGAYGVYHSVYDSMHWMEAFGDPTFNYFVTMAQQTGLLGMRMADTVLIPYNFTVYAEDLRAYMTVSKTVAAQYSIELDYSSLENAIAAFSSAAAQTASDIQQSLQSGTYDPELNQRLLYTERQFLGYGIPLRPYYRHVVQAPGLYQGYAPETFPGINQALRAANAVVAQLELETTANFINNAAVYLQTGSTLAF